ncbi:WXG100 family type VII secretion target [Nocardia stercoris]|uniref:WXG100 family type VII secretion target n=1 Tax=Nocardia stercoris TaxID=2483361 RepID=A0A3M2KS33_9NOCA|nr:WXG100 family type VII secretion target [Nocardia stercoris]RMI28467.1 WXG100 family type VII secretion target [Nocardia stercoris]
MATGFEADIELLNKTADWVDQFAQNLSDRIDKHMRAVRDVIGTEWTGSAATSHEDPWTEWEQAARSVVSSFYQDSGALRTVATTYLTTDDAHADQLGHLTGGLSLPPIG